MSNRLDIAPLTPAAFRALLRARGYRLADLARLWKLSRQRISQIANDVDRSPVHDLALWGLPPKRTAIATFARRKQLADALVGDTVLNADPVATLGGVELYAVFIVHTEQGGHLPEHCRGFVDALEPNSRQPRACIQFETGYREWYTIAFLNSPASFLAATGATADPSGGNDSSAFPV